MKRFIISLIISVLAVSVITMPTFADTSKSSNNQAIENQTQQKTITYSNEELGFSLELPASWENQYLAQYNFSYTDSGLVRTIVFSHKATIEAKNGSGALFAVSVMASSKENNVSNPGTGKVVTITDKYVYFIALAQDVDSSNETLTDYKKMVSDVENITKTLKTLQNVNNPNPLYDANSEYDKNGLSDNMIYIVTETIRRRLTPNDTFLMLNGAFTDAKVINNNGRTLVPIRFISESYGANVKWDEKARTVRINYINTDILMTIDKNEAIVNGKTVKLDTPPIIKDGVTYVPLRFVGESFGKEVGYLKGGYTNNISLAYNPVVWIDCSFEKVDDKKKEELTTYLKNELQKGFIYMKVNYKTDEQFNDIDQKTIDTTFNKIATDIEETKLVGQVGRYLMFQGTGTTLVDVTTNEIYFYDTYHTYCGIIVPNVNDVSIFGYYFFDRD